MRFKHLVVAVGSIGLGLVLREVAADSFLTQLGAVMMYVVPIYTLLLQEES